VGVGGDGWRRCARRAKGGHARVASASTAQPSLETAAGAMLATLQELPTQRFPGSGAMAASCALTWVNLQDPPKHICKADPHNTRDPPPG
jgi:hypothetical protein